MRDDRATPHIAVRRFGGATPTLSVVTVSNRADVLARCLGPSLEAQRGVPFEWIIVDNTSGAFQGAAAALNAAADRAAGDTLLFVHQDVSLFGDGWLRGLLGWMQSLDDVGVAGVIGRRGDDGGFVGYIRDRRAITGCPAANPVEVQTLDECVLALPRRFHAMQPFDESIGGWHVYGVDACLRARRAGLRAYVLPLFVHHDSSSTNYAGLAPAHAAIYRRHGSSEPTIHTTCGTITSRYSTGKSVVRSRLAAGVRRAVSILGRNVRRGVHALLEEVEEAYDDILVLHFAPLVPDTVPREIAAEALSPESTTSRPVRHVVITPDRDVDTVLAHPPAGRRLILLSCPTAAPEDQLKALRTATQGMDAAILALPDPADAAAWLRAFDAAGWQALATRQRGTRSLIELHRGSGG